MTTSIDELYDRAMALPSDVEDKFLELGRSLRQLLDRDPSLFQQVVKKRGLGRRKAYYLVEVSRKFEPLPISRVRLKKIGWTKLQIIGEHVTKDNSRNSSVSPSNRTPSNSNERCRARSRSTTLIACLCTSARSSTPSSKKSC